jgi:hypothetical protein
MIRRLAVVTTALAVVAVTVPGYAATKAKPKPKLKPSCLMLVDPTGDAKIHGQGNSYDADDIVSADIATGKKTVVGVLRLKSGDAASGLPTGATYRLMWYQTQRRPDGKTSRMQVAFFFYVYATGGSSSGYGVSADPNMAPSDSTGLKPQASMDANGVITWVLNRKDGGLGATGATFSGLSATSTIAINYQSSGGSGKFSGDPIDDATGHASYTDLQPSCVRAS